MKEIIMYLIYGTRGGEMRSRIINLLYNNPMNAHQVSLALKIDYKTAQYHLRILEENNLLRVVKKGEYGAIYIISDLTKENIHVFKEIWDKFGKK